MVSSELSLHWFHTAINSLHLWSNAHHLRVMMSCLEISALKVKGLDNCYSAAYMSQTQEKQHFTISKVATDWQELMIP